MRVTLYISVDDWLREPRIMTERALRRCYMMGLRDFQDVWLYRCSRPAWPRWILGMNVESGVLSHRQLTTALQGGHYSRNDTGFRVIPQDADMPHLDPYRRVPTAGLAFRAWLDHSFGVSLPVW